MALTRCYNCRRVVSDHANFCLYCGAPIHTPIPQLSHAQLRCNHCGRIVLNKDNFCLYCGAPISARVSWQTPSRYEPARHSATDEEHRKVQVSGLELKSKPTQTIKSRTIYLGKADAQGCFVHVSECFELGNSLFELTTTDSRQGTFVVIDNTNVHRFALMMPTENLICACSGESIQISTGKKRIVTDRPGEAVCEQGVWRITRKAAIHYE